MTASKRTGWVLIGAFIGALATSSVSAVRQHPDAVDASRLSVALASTNIGVLAFVKDTKSEGCWIVFSKETGVSVAPAPRSACQ
ncbi:MAG: hypothetical protein V7647_2744 [Acidobacteriota bacterium]|jgi:hypothetical protein